MMSSSRLVRSTLLLVDLLLEHVLLTLHEDWNPRIKIASFGLRTQSTRPDPLLEFERGSTQFLRPNLALSANSVKLK